MIDVIVGMLFGRKAEQRWDERAAARRWRAINQEKRREGCQCGRPGTHVRYGYGTVGGVPAEFWSCEEHVNVNGWQKTGDGPWEPCGVEFPASSPWIGPPVRAA